MRKIPIILKLMSSCLTLSCGMNTRYNPVLEAVITYTEELAHKQAKEADELLSQGVYLGSYHFFACEHSESEVMICF